MCGYEYEHTMGSITNISGLFPRNNSTKSESEEENDGLSRKFQKSGAKLRTH
jgi:hypothetical protein